MKSKQSRVRTKIKKHVNSVINQVLDLDEKLLPFRGFRVGGQLFEQRALFVEYVFSDERSLAKALPVYEVFHHKIDGNKLVVIVEAN